jgi:hypothetical protein
MAFTPDSENVVVMALGGAVVFMALMFAFCYLIAKWRWAANNAREGGEL